MIKQETFELRDPRWLLVAQFGESLRKGTVMGAVRKSRRIVGKYSANPWDLGQHPASDQGRRQAPPRDHRILTIVGLYLLAALAGVGVGASGGVLPAQAYR